MHEMLCVSYSVSFSAVEYVIGVLSGTVCCYYSGTKYMRSSVSSAVSHLVLWNT